MPLVAAVAIGGIVAALLAVGFLVVAEGGADSRNTDGPHFVPATGWDTYETGIRSPPQATSATAANVPLGKDALTGSFPWRTIGALGSGEVVIHATFGPASEVAAVDANVPKRDLPLSLRDVNRNGGIEGQPQNVTAYRLAAQVNGYNLDLFAFFGGAEPSAEAMAAAEEELARLVVPEAPARRSNLTPKPEGLTCKAEQLEASVFLQGAAGSLAGILQLVNTGTSACTLVGRPQITLRDVNGAVIETAQGNGPPQWQLTNARRPAGWPNVPLAPKEAARSFLVLRNWCRQSGEQVFFQVELPGVPGHRTIASTEIRLRCDVSEQPTSLSVAPFEPRLRD